MHVYLLERRRLVAIIAIVLTTSAWTPTALAQSPATAPHPLPIPMPWQSAQWMFWPQQMMAPFMNRMTAPATLNSMMLMMNPRFMPWHPPVPRTESGVVAHLPVVRIPGFPTQGQMRVPSNTVTQQISRQAKRNFFQSMMMLSPLSMRDMIGIMAEKMPVAEEVSFDDAIDSMKLRANEINFKLVGHNPLWKDVRAITGDENTPRVEIFQFCDAVVARKILDHVPEFLVFLPCRIALSEDADGRIWVMTLDWDVEWLDYAQNPNSHLALDLRADAKRIRDGIRYIMEGAATGDF